nr:hypothetical protein [Tanacetum cinerariifolium]
MNLRLMMKRPICKRAVEESLKDVHTTHQGLLPPAVFREPDSGRRQPLPEVQGKGKDKVIKEHVAHSLFDLNTPKKKSTTDQYILQRRTPKTADPTGPSTHHEDEKATHADVEIDTEELLTHTKKSGEEMSNTVILGTKSGGQYEKQGGPDPVTRLTLNQYHPKRFLLVSKAVDKMVTDAVDWAIQAPFRNHFRDLPEADMKEILHQRMWETNSYQANED